MQRRTPPQPAPEPQGNGLTFNDKQVRLCPFVRWLPSASSEPRAEHVPFYNQVWRKDDPFWNSHQPGTLWGCKCDLEEVADAPDTDHDGKQLSDDVVKAGRPVPALAGNPAITGEIFTKEASYFKRLDEDGNWKVHTTITPFLRNSIVKEWSQKNIPERTGIDIENSDFASGSMVINRNSIKSSFAHTNDDMLRVLLPTINKAKYKYVGWSATDEGKHTDLALHLLPLFSLPQPYSQVCIQK